MKRTILFILVILMVAFGAVYAAGPQISDVQTGDAQIITGAGQLTGVIIVSDGANSITLTLYDSTGSVISSRKLTPDMIITTSATNRTHFIGFTPDECRFAKGLYADFTTAGTVSAVFYTRR